MDRPAVGEWFTFKPNRGQSVRVCCTGYRGDALGKKGWIETIGADGKFRSVSPKQVVRDAWR